LKGSDDPAIWNEINWHALRAARTKGDKDAMNRWLRTFTSATPIRNPDIANDVVPLLRAAGRNGEADQVYAKVREGLEEEAAKLTGHPMPKNNLAWLSARCGERKDEALRLALEATQAMPDNAAFVDTLAEAHFQLGHYRQAVELETRVVAARPNDRFLRDQLKRFEAAEAAAKAKGE
jgi:tetratricopeptide (TPR) repeat protein